MARDENPPFNRGETFFGDRTISSQDITDTAYLEGKEWVFEDLNYNAAGQTKPVRSGRPVKCRVVRNNSAGALLPKRLASFQLTAGNYPKAVDGYADTTAELSYPVDEFLPSAGAQQYDLLWIVIEGPATVLTDLAGGANNVVNVGDRVVALTGATSGATTAGRVAPIDLTGATALLANQILNFVGRAVSAKTTGNTNADLLVDVGKW